MEEVLLSLASPQGIIAILFAGSGLFLLLAVGLGGVGQRDFNITGKIIFGLLGTIMFIFGIIAMTTIILSNQQFIKLVTNYSDINRTPALPTVQTSIPTATNIPSGVKGTQCAFLGY